MSAIAIDECVALRIDWGPARIVDPTVMLEVTFINDGSDKAPVYSVPRALADEFIAAECRVAELLDQIRACPRYRTVPARKLVLGDETVAEKTWEPN